MSAETASGPTSRSGFSASSQPSGPTAGERLADDMGRLRSDVASLKDSLARLVSQASGDAARTVRQAGESVASQVGAAATGVAEAGSILAASAKDRAQSATSELETIVRRNRLGALAGALFVGVMIGMMTVGRR